MLLSKKDFDHLSRPFPDTRVRDVEMRSNRSGWLNLRGFFQYTLVADEESSFCSRLVCAGKPRAARMTSSRDMGRLT